MEKTTYRTRWVIKADYPAMVQCNTNLTTDDIQQMLRKRNTIGMIVEDCEEHVIGFFIYSLRKNYIVLEEMAVNEIYKEGPIYWTIAKKLMDKVFNKKRGLRWRIDYYINDSQNSYRAATKLIEYGWRQIGNRLYWIELTDYSQEIENDPLCTL